MSEQPTDQLITLTLWGEKNERLLEQTIQVGSSFEAQLVATAKVKRIRIAYHEERKPVCHDCGEVVTRLVSSPIVGAPMVWAALCDKCEEGRSA